MSRHPHFWLVVLLMSASGCPLFVNLDDTELVARDAAGPDVADAALPDVAHDVSTDTAAPSDVTSPTDEGVDLAADVAIDLGAPGMTCPGATALDGTCDLVAQDCPSGDVCEVGLLMPGVETGCRAMADGVDYDLALGAACQPTGTRRCEPGLLCRDSSCVKYCYAETGVGCDPTEFCAPLDATNLPGVGWCTTSCP